MQQWKIQERHRGYDEKVLQGEDSEQERTEAFIFDEIIAVNFPKLMQSTDSRSSVYPKQYQYSEIYSRYALS